MGIWYANYVIYSDESSERHNVAEYLNQYLEMRLMEDGSAYMEMSYNSEEPDSAEILKVSWKLEDGKILVSLEEGDIYLDTVDGEFVGSLDEDTQVIFGRELVQTGEAQSLDNLDEMCIRDRFYSVFNKVATYRYRVDMEKCVHCGKCAKACQMVVNPVENPNSPECIRCGRCKQACPVHAIASGCKR